VTATQSVARAAGLAGALALAGALRSGALARRPGPPLPTADRVAVDRRFVGQDMAFIAIGARRLGADAAFVQFLLFLGGKLPGQETSADWPQVGPLARRVGRLDPGFTRAYTYGASILAWYRNVDRPEEALELLREARQANPQDWTFAALEAAIAFKKRSAFAEMADELAKIARRPDCPAMVKSILANTYKAQRRYAEALALWEDIRVSKDAAQYRARAEREIPALRALLSARKP
jgi:hypothetical protein